MRDVSALRASLSRSSGVRADRLAKLITEFQSFCREELGNNFESWENDDDAESVAKAAAEFGIHLFAEGRGKSDLVELLNGLWHRRESWRKRLSSAWYVVTRWGILEPTIHRKPLPLDAFRACVSWALLFGHLKFAASLLVCFSAGLRPGELFRLTGDCIKFVSQGIFVVLKSSKTSTRGIGTIQSVLITDERVCLFLRTNTVVLHSETVLCSEIAFRRLWNQMSVTLGLGHFTAGSLRAGMATHLRLRGVSLENIRWQLRHKNQATLESYIQSLAACNISEHGLLPIVFRLSKAFPTLMRNHS